MFTKISKKASKKLPSFLCPNPDCPVRVPQFWYSQGRDTKITWHIFQFVPSISLARQLSLQSLACQPTQPIATATIPTAGCSWSRQVVSLLTTHCTLHMYPGYGFVVWQVPGLQATFETATGFTPASGLHACIQARDSQALFRLVHGFSDRYTESQLGFNGSIPLHELPSDRKKYYLIHSDPRWQLFFCKWAHSSMKRFIFPKVKFDETKEKLVTTKENVWGFQEKKSKEPNFFNGIC